MKKICDATALVRVTIDIAETNKPIPKKYREDVYEWLLAQAVSEGHGMHLDYYPIDDDNKHDIAIRYIVSFSFNVQKDAT